jgi:ferrochelatase
MRRLAVVLFNLGGPDRPEAVRPFLLNLFSDPAIIRAPGPVRWMLARLISGRRANAARQIYARLGGGSPLRQNTEVQAAALETALVERGLAAEVRCFIAMRYWHPLSDATAAAVRDWAPDRVVLLPLYPQYSTTTTASSLSQWRKAAQQARLHATTVAVCCYPTQEGFVSALARRVQAGIREASRAGRPRVLFSAHGLPARVVARGDPYPLHVALTAEAVGGALAAEEFDWVVCYQSRVGPLEWIRPYIDEALQRAAADGVPVVVAPIAFVSEHSETLVELDVEYRDLAAALGVPAYVRVPTVSADSTFIEGLGTLVAAAAEGDEALRSAKGGRLCPGDQTGCAFARRQ